MYIRPHSYEIRPAAHGFSHEHHLYRYSEIWSDEGFELRFSYVYGVFETFMFTKRRFYFSYPIIPNCSIQTNPLKGNLKGKNKGKQNCKQKNLLAILYLLGRGTIT